LTSPIGVGVLGLGRAFTLMLPTWRDDPRVRLVAAFDPRAPARAAFAQHFGAIAYDSAQAVCADPAVQWVYVATPHGLHAEHVCLAAQHGKHVLVEKPMALNLAQADAMIAACERAGTHLVVGHSHSFNAPVRLARQMIASGRYGAVRMIHAMQYTDFLYRPRRPEELDTAQGGGVVLSQASHQVDIARLLGGGRVERVRAMTGRWDPRRPTEGAYSALLRFDSGAFASLSYNGYGHYDSDTLMDGIGELGGAKDRLSHARTRQRHALTTDEQAEAQAKAERNFGGAQWQPAPAQAPTASQHFGPVIVSCEGADLRLNALGVEVCDANGPQQIAAPLPAVPRAEVIDEIWAADRLGRQPLHGGPWSRATLEVCLALLSSQASGSDILMEHQVAVRD
jgi:phthalate 4,5-cis-dihydrodiol dehydrogenase